MPKSLIPRVKRLLYPRAACLLRLPKTLFSLPDDTYICIYKHPALPAERYQARAQAANLTIATPHCLVLHRGFPACNPTKPEHIFARTPETLDQTRASVFWPSDLVPRDIVHPGFSHARSAKL
jgi:hypothetical protein